MIYASCDTFIAQATDGTQLFAKNSDRDPNEAHHIIYAARQDFKEVKFLVNIHLIYVITFCAQPSTLSCTYVSIPQVATTNAVLFCKPVWIWYDKCSPNIVQASTIFVGVQKWVSMNTELSLATKRCFRNLLRIKCRP
jgi:hypothetical protein